MQNRELTFKPNLTITAFLVSLLHEPLHEVDYLAGLDNDWDEMTMRCKRLGLVEESGSIYPNGRCVKLTTGGTEVATELETKSKRTPPNAADKVLQRIAQADDQAMYVRDLEDFEALGQAYSKGWVAFHRAGTEVSITPKGHARLAQLRD